MRLALVTVIGLLLCGLPAAGQPSQDPGDAPTGHDATRTQPGHDTGGDRSAQAGADSNVQAGADSNVQAGGDSSLQPRTQNGIRFVTGGVGNEEQQALDRMASDYSTRIAFESPGGAYLGDVEMKLGALTRKGGTSGSQESSGSGAMLETTTQGPIFLGDLEPGRYQLEARAEGRKSEQRVFDVPKNGQQVRLYVTLVPSDGSGTTARSE